MDEEELQQPQKKIDIDSFFNRVDAVEGVASNALKQSNLNANTIQANKTLINSISVTIEAMRTEIRDIANYIVIENKLEKDKKEDEKFEAEDKEQKENLADRLKAAAEGVIRPKDIKPGEEDKGGKKTGGGFLGGLFKIVAGLGLAAGFIALAPYIVPALLIGAGGLLLSFLIAKITPPIVNFVKKVIEDPMKYFASAIRNTLGKVPLIKGPALAWADSIDSGAEKLSASTADSVKGNLENVGKGGDGKGGTGGGITPTGGGETGGGETDDDAKADDAADNEKITPEKVSDSNLDLKDKNVENSSKNILDSVESEEKTDGVEDLKQGNIPKTYRGVEVVGRNWDDVKKDMEEAKIAMEEIMQLQKRIFSGKLRVANERDASSELINAYQDELDEADRFLGTGRFDPQIRGIKTGERLEVDESGKILNPEVLVDPKFSSDNDLSLNQPPGNSFNNNNNVKNQRMQLDSQVSSAEIKGTGTTIRAVRMTSNQFLSTHDKNIPIEVLRAIA